MDSPATLQQVVRTGTDGIKLHPLHVVEGSILGKAWHAGRLEVPTLEECRGGGGDDPAHARRGGLSQGLRLGAQTNAVSARVVREPLECHGGHRGSFSGQRWARVGSGLISLWASMARRYCELH